MATATAEPKPKREGIEWCDIWVPDATSTALPRVLLIGDSISRGYYDAVQKQLHGSAYVARLATSAAVGDPALLEQLGLLLGQYPFDVIHFNVGLHGMSYTEADYRRHFPDLLRLIERKAPGAKLVWTSTTPWREAAPNTAQFHDNNERVIARNRIAADLVAGKGIATDDLYSSLVDHPEYWSADGVHFNEAGQAAEAAQVAARIRPLLPTTPR